MIKICDEFTQRYVVREKVDAPSAIRPCKIPYRNLLL